MGCYLVTGGCGFIGSHLVDALVADGHRVRVLDDLSTGRRGNLPSGVELRVACVTDAEAVNAAMADVDGCYHLAAIASVQRSNEAWAMTHRVNLGGIIHVFEAARARRTPVVYASSAAVYGAGHDGPIVEQAEHRPLTAYGADKLGCELHALVAGTIHAIPTFGLRFFNVYGPRQDPGSPYSGVISIFMDRVSRRRGVTVFGDGRQSRDFIYVSDVVTHLRAAMDRAATDAPVVNVCTGRATSLNRLADLIMAAADRTVPVSHGEPRPGDIRHSLGVPDRAIARLGVRADIPLAEGLRRTFAAFSVEA